MSADPAELTLVELLPLLAARALSARELVQACLARVAASEPVVRAFVTPTPGLALAAAARADAARAAGRPTGLLAGVPVVVKDVLLVAGTPTTAGSAASVSTAGGVLRAGRGTGTDAAAWERLATAGAGLVGKSTTHEFAYGTASGPARNPWDPTRTPGGSSGGSAVALAARMAPAALGSDTSGSLRIPAAACGVGALRGAHGRVSAHGLLPLSPSLDVVGPMARRMLDVAVLARVLAGPDDRDPRSRREPVPSYPLTAPADLQGVRVGLPALGWDGVDPEVVRAARAGLDAAVDAGAELVELDAAHPSREALDAARDAFGAIIGIEAREAHRELLARRDLYTPQVLARVLGARPTRELAAARAAVAAWGQRWRRVVDEQRLTALAHPTLDQAPPVVRVDDDDPQGPTTPLPVPWLLPDGPSASVPVGLDGRGLPVGLTLAGAPEREAQLLAVAVGIDEAVGAWRIPPGSVPVAVPGPPSRPAVPGPSQRRRGSAGDGTPDRAGPAGWRTRTTGR